MQADSVCHGPGVYGHGRRAGPYPGAAGGLYEDWPQPDHELAASDPPRGGFKLFPKRQIGVR